jgi:hypothetical protein
LYTYQVSGTLDTETPRRCVNSPEHGTIDSGKESIMQPQSSPEQILATLPILEQHLRQWKAAYYRHTPGVTYDDMATAARRLLEMRAAYERATGRPQRVKVTKKAIADLLR